MLTIDELLARLRPHGCRYMERAGRYGPQGPPSSRSIVRTLVDPGTGAKDTKVAILPSYIGEDDQLATNTVRSILSQLGLSEADLGIG